MSETSELEAVKAGAAVLYTVVNGIYLLHEQTTLEPTEGAEAIAACGHCSEIADGIVHYPCPTVQILLNDFVEESRD